MQDQVLAARPKNMNDIIFVDNPVIPYFYQGATVTSNRPDVFIINHTERKFTIIKFAVPYNKNILKSHQRKIDRYKPLHEAIKNNHNDYSVTTVPIVVGALGGMVPWMAESLERIGIEKPKKIRELMMRMQKCTIEGSMDVWNRRHCKQTLKFNIAGV